MKKFPILAAILLLVTCYSASAEEVRVSGMIDKNRVEIDEEIAFTIQILGARGNLQAPRLPLFDGFDSFYTGRTSHFTFINGKSSATVEFSYVLVPKVAGKFTLSPVQVWIGGKSYSTSPFEVEVVGTQIQPGASSASSQTQPVPLAPVPSRQAPAPPSSVPAATQPELVSDDNVFLKATVDKETVFPNEQVLLTYTLYTRYDTRYEGFEEEPSVSGFWIEDFPLDRDLGRETVNLNGRRYVKAEVRKIALFPTAPAEYTIQPGVAKVSVREEPKTSSVFDEFFGDSFFNSGSFFVRRMDRLLKPSPLLIKVRPFPDTGKPASFNGAVGRFRMSGSLDKSEAKQNEPVTLKLILEGEGNLETLPRPPVPELTGFKVYEGDTSTQTTKIGTTLGGQKTFEVIFIPTESGGMAVPPLEFSFFDPRTQNYQVLRTPSFPLEVLPSEEPFHLPAGLAEKQAFQKEVQLEARDIHYIHEEFPDERGERIRKILLRSLLGANLAGLLLTAAGLIRNRREALFAKDIGLKRRALARAHAERRMRVLKRLARNEDAEEAERFIEEAEKVLSEYFSNKFNVSAYGFTREWLEQKLAEIWTTEGLLLKEIREFYDTVTEARFGRGALPVKKRRELLERIENSIRRIEKKI